MKGNILLRLKIFELDNQPIYICLIAHLAGEESYSTVYMCIIFFLYSSLSDLPDKTAELIVCVAYNSIRVGDVKRSQLASSAKALGLKNIQQDKLSLVRAVAQSLLDHGIVKVMVDLANASRDDIKKMKPF